MRYLPKLQELAVSRAQVAAFRGLNRTAGIEADEWADMENLTGAQYPALAPRGSRGFVRRIGRPNGLFALDKLCWVDGTDFVYDGTVRGQVTDGEKQFVAMGAYVLIWPDKVCYNTATEVFEKLEARHETAGEVTFTLCRADGSAYEDYTASSTAPESPEDGQLWVDTRDTPHVLKQFSQLRGMWISMPTTYVKIAAPGIGADFAAYDGVTLKGCEDEALNGDVILYGADDDFVIVTGAIGAVYTQAGPVTLLRTVPDMDFVTEYGNRVWGCSSAAHEVYACKLGDPKNFRCYMGVSTDSYAATIGSPGPFTGACTHRGAVMFFKQDVIHQVQGYKPSNFEILEEHARGVMPGCERSIAIVSETLYYKARGDVCAYQAALPNGIGAKLAAGEYGDAVAGDGDGRYYVSMRDASGGWHLFVYDESRGLWHREDDTHALGFARAEGVLYCLRADGWLFTVDGTLGAYATDDAFLEGQPRGGTRGGLKSQPAKAGQAVMWMAETGDIGLRMPGHKYITKLQLRMTVAAGALVKVWVRYDGLGAWEEVFRVNPTAVRGVTAPIIPRRCDTMRIRLTGHGEMRLYAITRTVEEGTEV